jgi:lipopolysaccharide export system protein LptA
MDCKFRAADMPSRHPRFLCAVVLVASSLGGGFVRAEMADRSKPMTIEADQPGTVDLQHQVVVFNGNVVITQGTMLIRAERIEVRERSDGYRMATATGGAARQASFRQKRDGVDETMEGSADRIEFDARTDVLRLEGNAAVRRMRSGILADEIIGSLITWNNTSELFIVHGGNPTAANPSGRVRAVFTPPASAPASASNSTGAAPLKPSRALGAPR